MEILERSPQKIVIREEGYWGWIVARLIWLGFTFLPLSILVILSVLLRIETLSCQRVEPQQVNCQLDSRRWLGGGDVQSTYFPSVQKMTKEERGTAEDGIYYSYFIHTKQGQLEFNYFSDDTQLDSLIQFLENSEKPSIKIEEDVSEPFLVLIQFATTGFLIGLVFFTSAYQNKFYIFDGKNQKVRILIEKHQKIFPEEYPFPTLQFLEIKEFSGEDGNIYTLFLKLDNGKRIQVSPTTDKIEEIEEIAKLISDLLKINVTIKPRWGSSELRRRAEQKSHPVYLSMVD
jgi:hypothetical protein